MFEIRITERAELDIQTAYDWWSKNRSAEQAARWVDAIYPAISSLAAMPRRCSYAEEREYFPGELRQLLFGIGSRATHRIVFTIEHETVYILRVRSTSQQSLGENELSK